MVKLVVVSGAGLSASAGIPTYRGDANAGSTWSLHNMTDICTKGQEFAEESIAFYERFRRMEATVSPSPVHKLFARLQATYGPDRVKLHTQNIDTLLERAGCSAVHHVHGNIAEWKCARCNAVYAEDTGHECLSNARRNVVFYGEKGHYGPMIDDLVDLGLRDV